MGDGDDAVETWYVCKVCPFPDECTAENFKKWRCWGDSESTARHQVYKHLMQSGKHHGMDAETANEAADSCEIVMESASATSGNRREKKRPHDGSSDAHLASRPRPPDHGPPRTSAHGATSAFNDAAMAVVTQSRSNPMIQISFNDLKEMTECLGRAARATTQLERLCVAAAECCKAERQVIVDAQEAFQRRVDAVAFSIPRPS